MVESVVIIIGCYLFSALMVHVAYELYPQLRSVKQHYILVTKNNEQHAELVMRAITWHAWLFGRRSRISVIDENSDDQTLPIIRRLDQQGHIQIMRTANWAETERLVRHMKRSAKHDEADGAKNTADCGRMEPQDRHSEAVTVIYVNRPEDRMKLPLFG